MPLGLVPGVQTQAPGLAHQEVYRCALLLRVARLCEYLAARAFFGSRSAHIWAGNRIPVNGCRNTEVGKYCITV